jgi:glucose-6-phosphate isomerase
LDGKVVNQGIAVYGNKGSTDQHAYIQQLREGVHNFFVTFIEVLKDRDEPELEVEAGITAGDYLKGFLLGTRSALHENGRQSISITVKEMNPFTVGMLIALYERAVGLYASLVNVNAYHQPGVEAGKKAAAGILDLQKSVVGFLDKKPGEKFSAETIGLGIQQPDETELIYKILEHLAANPSRGIDQSGTGPESEFGCP